MPPQNEWQTQQMDAPGNRLLRDRPKVIVDHDPEVSGPDFPASCTTP
jgi:hypothetical protein